jgi:hypothetical protein
MGGSFSISDHGGGSSIFNSSYEEVLTAKEPKRPIRNVFISFHSKDEEAVNELREQAKVRDGELTFRDYSVKEPFEEKWKTNCREQINRTSATIVMIGENTAGRSAVDWEIEESYRQGHRVIGVRMRRGANDPVPEPLKEHNARIIDWDPATISRELDHEE